LTILGLVLWAGPSAAAQGGGSGNAALRASLKRELEFFLTNQGTAEHVSAVSLRVTFRTQRPSINIPVGTSTYGGAEPISTANLWQIGSNTKAFTAVMLLQLEAEHKLSLHDTLGKWLPRYRAWRQVTIKHLLDMTSGIPDYLNIPGFLRAYAADPTTEFSSRRLVSYARRGQPTHGYSYSNTNYILAQMILKKATRGTYADQLRKRITAPLGLRTMTYQPSPYPRSFTDRLPAGYLFQTSTPPLKPLLGRDLRRFNLSYAQGAGGIVSSLKDATRWERALYQGRMLPGKQQRELESVVSQKTGKPIDRPTRSDPQGYGLGVMEGHTTLGPIWAYEGETFGYRVLHIYLQRSGTLLAIGVNSSASDDELSPLGFDVLAILHEAGLA
jgi:D-alanyl-D-alanine carboxypeptidase